jgi:hypothetical protein
MFFWIIIDYRGRHFKGIAIYNVPNVVVGFKTVCFSSQKYIFEHGGKVTKEAISTLHYVCLKVFCLPLKSCPLSAVVFFTQRGTHKVTLFH